MEAYRLSAAARKGRVGGFRSVMPPQVYGRTQRLEAGHQDVSVATRRFNTTGVIVHINAISQGASQAQRVGKRAALKSLQIRGTCQNGTAAVNNYGALLIVYDKRPTGALPAVTDVLETASSYSFMEDSNASRFRVLRRLEYDFQGQGGATNSDDFHHIVNEFINLKMLPVIFKDTGTGTIADVSEGALYAVWVGNNATGADLDAFSNLGFRLRFVDQ